MAYEPDQRYLKDLSTRQEVNAPSDGQAPTDRGQVWAVTNHIRGRWTRRGASIGLMFGAMYILFDGNVPLLRGDHLLSTLAFFGAVILGGALVGFVAALIRRRFIG
jgi:hypothetical protein